MIDGRKLSNQNIQNNIKTYEKLENLLLVKEMITELVV